MRISDWSSDVCSSDLFADLKRRVNIQESRRLRDAECIADCRNENISLPDCPYGVIVADRITRVISEQAETLDRSEEHTSELQSLMRISYAVFCLKKQNNTMNIVTVESSNSRETLSRT